jgi:hypothetical protein
VSVSSWVHEVGSPATGVNVIASETVKARRLRRIAIPARFGFNLNVTGPAPATFTRAGATFGCRPRGCAAAIDDVPLALFTVSVPAPGMTPPARKPPTGTRPKPWTGSIVSVTSQNT